MYISHWAKWYMPAVIEGGGHSPDDERPQRSFGGHLHRGVCL
jgi:hypothetical protein